MVSRLTKWQTANFPLNIDNVKVIFNDDYDSVLRMIQSLRSYTSNALETKSSNNSLYKLPGSEILSAFVLCNKKGCAKHLHQKYPTVPYGLHFQRNRTNPAQLQRELYDDTRDFIICIKLGRSYEDVKKVADENVLYSLKVWRVTSGDV